MGGTYEFVTDKDHTVVVVAYLCTSGGKISLSLSLFLSRGAIFARQEVDLPLLPSLRKCRMISCRKGLYHGGEEREQEKRRD